MDKNQYNLIINNNKGRIMINILKEKDFNELNKVQKIEVLYDAVKLKHGENVELSKLLKSEFSYSENMISQLNDIESHCRKLEVENTELKEIVKSYSYENFRVWLVVLICSGLFLVIGANL